MLMNLLGVNWKTTLAGGSAIIAAVGRIALAWKSKDIMAILADGQLIFESIGMIILGLGLLKAKDQNVTGAGVNARQVPTGGR